jgi:hypothetical protein
MIRTGSVTGLRTNRPFRAWRSAAAEQPGTRTPKAQVNQVAST